MQNPYDQNSINIRVSLSTGWRLIQLIYLYMQIILRAMARLGRFSGYMVCWHRKVFKNISME